MPRFADEQIAAFVAQPAPLDEPDVAALRAGVDERAHLRARGPEMHQVADLRVGDRAARLFRPAAGPLPLVVYLHGGGWTIGTLASFDRACRRLADGSGCAVLCLDYRLAPEHPWPASVDDTVAALRWVAGRPAELGEITGVAVAGDSAGGTLAALACLRLRGSDALPELQVLLYSNTDLAAEGGSMEEKRSGFGLDVDTIRFFNRQWVPDPARWSDPEVSPLHARDLTGVPPALVVTAEHDPLRDQGEAYAHRLQATGIEVELRREPGMIHSFMTLDEISPACAAAADRVAADLHRLLSP